MTGCVTVSRWKLHSEQELGRGRERERREGKEGERGGRVGGKGGRERGGKEGGCWLPS